MCLGYETSRLSVKDFEMRLVEQDVHFIMLEDDHELGEL